MDNLDSATTISSSYSGLDPDTLVFTRLILEQASVTEVTEFFSSSLTDNYFQAYKSLVQSYGWKSFTLLYQDNHGLMRLQELVTSSTQADVKIEIKRLNFNNNDENK